MSNKKQNIIIIGASGHAQVIIDILVKNDSYTIVGLVDNYASRNENLLGYPILGTEDDIPELLKTYAINAMIIALEDNQERKNSYNKIKNFAPLIKFVSAIHPNTIIGENVSLGNGIAIMDGVIVHYDSKIGDSCILNTNSSMDHDSEMKKFSSLEPNTKLEEGVLVGSCALISLGATINKHIVIGANVIVAAGAEVHMNVADTHIEIGTPSKTMQVLEAKSESTFQQTNNKDDIAVNAIEIVGYNLNCHKLETEKDIKNYKQFLYNFEGYDTFYKTELFSVENSENEHLSYFTLTKNNLPIIIMPFALRKIIFNEKETTYYDVTSFYGYSGPLFKDDIKENDIINFWHLVDSWYRKNKVISEFIRFNLDGNNKNYSGKLTPTLNNVKGSILKNIEKQWVNFPSKVRNNYRKAVSNGLVSKIYHQDIDEAVIEIFHEIYINTMDRHNAETNYYFTLEYFKNLITSNPSNTTIIIVYKADIAISAELVLLNKDAMYSFLGGTKAEYFDLRPNDFLKMEVMNWGRSNDFTNYILGGGRVNDDSLYKYKKSFFPKDVDIIYYTGRKIINEQVYEKLVSLNLNEPYKINELDIINNYFPLYRKELS